MTIHGRKKPAIIVTARGSRPAITSNVTGAKGVKSVSGMGLMIGIETDRDAGAVISECRERGVLVIKAKNKVRLLPALNIDMELLKRAINVLKDVIAKEQNGDD